MSSPDRPVSLARVVVAEGIYEDITGWIAPQDDADHPLVSLARTVLACPHLDGKRVRVVLEEVGDE